ncbi:MAG: hypothetical protein ABFS10_05495 [Bacteroidota bacterium]
MKKILLVPALGILLSCTGGTGKSAEATKSSQEQIEAIEQSNQKIDMVMDSSEVIIDTLQGEIDEILNDI